MNRRNFFKALAAVPVVAIGGAVLANVAQEAKVGVSKYSDYHWSIDGVHLGTFDPGELHATVFVAEEVNSCVGHLEIQRPLTEQEIAAIFDQRLLRAIKDIA